MALALLDPLAMNDFDAIPEDLLVAVTGGSGTTAAKWRQIREQAQPYCPETAARYRRPPRSREHAEAIGAACLAEMGPLYAALGGSSKIEAGIDAAFPRRDR